MPRPTKVPETVLQQAMALFYHAPIEDAIASLNAVNALVVERAKAEHYVPTDAAQDTPARPKAPRPASTGRPRGRPPAAQPADATPPAGTTADTPPPPETPPGAPPATPPDASEDQAPEGGSLAMPPIGGETTPTTPVAVPGGRAQTT